MSESSKRRSEEFLKIADQFKLGALVTESSHPATANLGEVAKRNVVEALRLLFEVDADVVRKYREFVESGRAGEIAATVLRALRNGGRIFFTGCGATGRLSIQLDSIWRDFWQRVGRVTPCAPSSEVSSPGAHGVTRPTLQDASLAEEFENRTFSVMAGGDFALIRSVEGFEDFTEFGKKQIGDLGVCDKDVVFAITEGGETSFVIGTAWKGVEVGAKVYFIYNNPDKVLCKHVERSREVIQDSRIEKINLTTGPMAITGSTRMQATSIQLAVMVTVLEMVVRRSNEERRMGIAEDQNIQHSTFNIQRSIPTPDPSLEGNFARSRAPSFPSLEGSGVGSADGVPKQFLAALEEMHATLKSPEVLSQLAKLVELEESVYRSGRKNSYFADGLGIDVLTDTTERSPTYCTPSFRKFDDTTAAESWSFLFMPDADTACAWRRILKREPRCVEWSKNEVRALVSENKLARTLETIRKISAPELMRFKIGLDGLPHRPLRKDDSAVAIIGPSDSQGYFESQLAAASKAGAHIGAIHFVIRDSSSVSSAGARTGLSAWVSVPVPKTEFLLDGVMRAGVKMLLNALSTCTMVRLGRVMGNTMIWVVASNLKLIDRATRYIQRLTGLDYPQANQLLFEVIEYVEPRMKTDKAYPPVVGLAVMRHRHGVGNEEAERLLLTGV